MLVNKLSVIAMIMKFQKNYNDNEMKYIGCCYVFLTTSSPHLGLLVK
jgi:hypothetical protein